MILTRVRVSLALVSLRKNGGLLVVYITPAVRHPLDNSFDASSSALILTSSLTPIPWVAQTTGSEKLPGEILFDIFFITLYITAVKFELILLKHAFPLISALHIGHNDTCQQNNNCRDNYLSPISFSRDK